ncbi:MAG: penicillin-binding protein activator LpoB [Sumerlaeia bacterium]
MKLLFCVLFSALILTNIGCSKKSFEIRDIDPAQAGTVRGLGPESQDAIRVSDLMSRSLLENPVIANASFPPTIVMLEMKNNSRFPFNKDVFSTRLKAQLNIDSKGKMRFVARDLAEEINAERELKRDGFVDYDPNRRTSVQAGADYFLVGELSGLSTRSRMGDSQYSVYTFKLVDTETGIELWEDLYEVKKEGKDDVIYQ